MTRTLAHVLFTQPSPRTFLHLISLLPQIGQIDFGDFWPIDFNLPTFGNIPAFEIGKCADPPTVPNFDAARFLGSWYAQRQTPSSFQVG